MSLLNSIEEKNGNSTKCATGDISKCMRLQWESYQWHTVMCIKQQRVSRARATAGRPTGRSAYAISFLFSAPVLHNDVANLSLSRALRAA